MLHQMSDFLMGPIGQSIWAKGDCHIESMLVGSEALCAVGIYVRTFSDLTDECQYLIFVRCGWGLSFGVEVCGDPRMTSLTWVNTCGSSMWLRIALWGTSLRGTLNHVSDVGQYLGLVDTAGEWFLKSEPGAIFWQRACSRHERRQ